MVYINVRNSNDEPKRVRLSPPKYIRFLGKSKSKKEAILHVLCSDANMASIERGKSIHDMSREESVNWRDVKGFSEKDRQHIKEDLGCITKPEPGYERVDKSIFWGRGRKVIKTEQDNKQNDGTKDWHNIKGFSEQRSSK